MRANLFALPRRWLKFFWGVAGTTSSNLPDVFGCVAEIVQAVERKLRLLEAIEGHTIVELCEMGAALDEETCTGLQKMRMLISAGEEVRRKGPGGMCRSKSLVLLQWA